MPDINVNCIVNCNIKLSEPTKEIFLSTPLAYNNTLAHAMRVTVYNDDGTEADLTGVGVTGVFLRADNQAVDPINGTIIVNASGVKNIAEIILPASCYIVPGRYTFTMNLTANGSTRTALWVEGHVKRNTSGTIIDPGTPVGNIEQAIGNANAAASAATTAATAANTAATNAANAATYTAPTEASSTASKAYAVGDYFVYNGKLYITTSAIASGGTITPNTNCAEIPNGLSGEVGDLKSAIVQEQTGVVTFESGTYADIDGTHKSTNSARIRNARPLPVNGLISITIPDGYQAWFFRLNIDLTLISAYGSWLSGKVNISNIATSATEYLTFALKNTSTPTSDISGEVATVQATTVYVRDMDIITNEVRNIPQENLAFADRVLPTNLFDYTSDDMCKPGWWYYGTTVGSVISAKQSSSTTHYVAIKVPVYDSTKVTLGIYPDDMAKLVYWVGAVDADMRLIGYSIVNQNAPVTYNLPTGTVYFLASYNLGSANFDTYLPKVMAVNGESITEYSPYFEPYYLLKNCRAESVTPEKAVKLMMPDVYDAVVGETIQIFYKGIINAITPDRFDVTVQCASGSAYKRYFELTPTTAGNISAIFTLYDSEHNQLDTKTVTFSVHSAPSNPASQKNVLCVGDSLTTGGTWPVELHRRLTGSNGTPPGSNLSNINFIGTRVASNVHYEGYGGWTFNSYNTANVSTNTKIITCTHDKTEAQDQHSIYKDGNNDTWKLETIESGSIKIIAVSSEGRNFPSTGTLTWVSGGVNHSNIVYTASENAPGNPFWDTDANKVDFETYAESLGVSSIDYVLVLLGWNSASLSESDYKTQAQTFITNVHASYPNAKIILMGLEIPAYDGIASNYGATGTYGNYYGLMNYVFSVDERYADLVDNNSNTYSVNLSGQFDTEYNMPTSTRQVNTRNAETETYQSNGVHPATPGYYQIADAFYRKLVALL